MYMYIGQRAKLPFTLEEMMTTIVRESAY